MKDDVRVELEPGVLEAEGRRLLEANAFGRSRKLGELFEYLLTCSVADIAPKEVEIAKQVFGGAERGTDGDATVRAHVHRLRAKLDEYYRDSGDSWRLAIPKGGYRLVAESSVADQAEQPSRRAWPMWLKLVLAMALLFAMGFAAGHWSGPRQAGEDRLDRLRSSVPWQSIVTGNHPINIVLGDYFQFVELNDAGRPARVIRDFTVNSRTDFEQFQRRNPETSARYVNVSQSYVPNVVGEALRHIIPITRSDGAHVETTRVITTSQILPETLKQTNLVYIGNLRGLGPLRAPLFDGSRFSLDLKTFTIVDRTSGRRYVAPSQIEESHSNLGRAYALVSLFKGPADNWVLIIVGSRSSALIQAAEFLTDPTSLANITAKVKPNQPFDALLAVEGISGSGLRATVLTIAPRPLQQNWSGRKPSIR